MTFQSPKELKKVKYSKNIIIKVEKGQYFEESEPLYFKLKFSNSNKKTEHAPPKKNHITVPLRENNQTLSNPYYQERKRIKLYNLINPEDLNPVPENHENGSISLQKTENKRKIRKRTMI